MNSKRFVFLFLKYVQSLYTTLILPPLNGMDNVLVLRMEFRGLVVKTLDLKIMVSSVVGSNPLRGISKIFFHKSSESFPNRLKTPFQSIKLFAQSISIENFDVQWRKQQCVQDRNIITQNALRTAAGQMHFQSDRFWQQWYVLTLKCNIKIQ